MALDKEYVVTSDLEGYFVDKDTGTPLANGKLTFYRDSARTVKKDVYQLTGAPPNYTYTVLPNPLTLSAVGTPQNSDGDNIVIYYKPYITDPQSGEDSLDLYYITCENENGIQEFTREAWPNLIDEAVSTLVDSNLDNQISNPTFTNILFNKDDPTILTAAGANKGVYNIAPDWDFILTGTGTVTIQRVAIAGIEHVPNNPPFALDVAVSGGITECYLRQRFNYNSGLWASNSNTNMFLTGSFVVRNQLGGDGHLQMYYQESTGNPLLIIDGTFQGAYTRVSGSAAVPVSADINKDKLGYTDIYLSFNASSQVRVTSIQIIPTQGEALTLSTLPLDQNSSNRNESYQGDYYIPRLNQKPLKSFLTGWDFPLNPFQFGVSPAAIFAASPRYIADQTIAFTSSATGLTYARDAVTNGLSFSMNDSLQSLGILQYLSQDQVKDLITNRLSVNVFAYHSNFASGSVKVRVSLFRGSSSATIPNLPALIGTLQPNGTFTLTAANWTEIPRSGLDTAQAQVSVVQTSDVILNGNNDYGFNGWQLTDATQISNTDKFAIVVTFYLPTTGTTLKINSISLVPGDIPCRPAPQTYEEVLEECQNYYEKSYPSNIQPGTIFESSLMFQQTIRLINNGFAVYASAFSFRFQTIKRVMTPTLTIYNPATGAINEIRGQIANGNSTSIPLAGTSNDIAVLRWQYSISTKGAAFERVNGGLSTAIMIAAIGTVDSGLEGNIRFHYIADARLGIV